MAIPLMVLAVDVIEEVDGVFDDAIAHIAVETPRLGRGCGLVDHHLFSDLRLQVNLQFSFFIFNLIFLNPENIFPKPVTL